MTCGELAAVLKGLGAHNAVNLDGGGSSAMYVGGQGIVNRPSDGSERVTANQLAVFAPSSGSLGVLKGLIYEGSNTSARLSGVTVQVTGGPRIVTGTDGVYEIDVPAGTYTIKATKPGFTPETVTRTVTAGGTIWGSMGLTRVAVPVDTDGDGVTDTADNCPEHTNTNQRDTDADGDGDACDGDDDADGVPDEDDNCPLISNASQLDTDGDRIGDACGMTMNPPPQDAGVPEEETEEDSGVVIDAGIEIDAGVTEPIDAGTEPEPTVPMTGCTSAPGLIALLAIAFLRRRKMR